MIFEKYQNIIVFDFETTGLSFIKDRIIELGLINLVKNPTTNKFECQNEVSMLVNVGFPISEEITNLTNITNEMLIEKGKTEQEVFKEILKHLNKETLLMAYNIHFDLNFLNEIFRRHLNDNKYMIKQDILDVMAIYKDRHPYPHKLSAALEKYQVNLPNSHRALDDALATLALLRKMTVEKNNIELYINKIGYNSKYGISGIKFSHIKYLPQSGNKEELVA